MQTCSVYVKRMYTSIQKGHSESSTVSSQDYPRCTSPICLVNLDCHSSISKLNRSVNTTVLFLNSLVCFSSFKVVDQLIMFVLCHLISRVNFKDILMLTSKLFTDGNTLHGRVSGHQPFSTVRVLCLVIRTTPL